MPNNDERTYYVICEDNCRFESMTKEQIIAAIVEATGNIPGDVDAAFITKIKEQNADQSMKVWAGTMAQYNALDTHAADTLYFIRENGVVVAGNSVDLSGYATEAYVGEQVAQAIGNAIEESY